MKPFILSVRAVGCEFASRCVKALWLPFAMGSVIVTVVLVWLVHFSLWWLVVAGPLWFVMIFGVVILMVAHATIRAFRPPLSTEQRPVVASFVDKLQRVAETIGTPTYLLLLKVLHDILRPRQGGFIPQTVSDSTTLHKDFLQIQRLFH